MSRIFLDPHSGMPVYLIGTPADLDDAIIEAERAGAPGRAHLLRQFKSGRLVLLDVQRSTSARLFETFAAQCGALPALAIVGADEALQDGPEEWPLTKRMVRWARAAILHAAGSDVGWYEIACVAAELYRRVLLVECTSAALPAWNAIAQAACGRRDLDYVLEILPMGGVHPLPTPAAPSH
jgi:hypothetical protein